MFDFEKLEVYKKAKIFNAGIRKYPFKDPIVGRGLILFTCLAFVSHYVRFKRVFAISSLSLGIMFTSLANTFH